MADNLISFTGGRSQSVIELLEEKLAEARQGKILAVALATIGKAPDGEERNSCAVSGGTPGLKMLGLIDILKSDLRSAIEEAQR